MRTTTKLVSLAGIAAAATVLATGCSSDTGNQDSETGLPASGGASGGNGAAGGSSGSGSIAVGGSAGSGGTSPGTGGTSTIPVDPVGGEGGGPPVGNGTPETCDGIDNDENGIVDDVDAGGDGVCDCLNIGTIGHIGPWSDGGDIFSTWLNERTPQGAVALADQELTSALLAPLQVIVVLHAATLEIERDGNITPAHHPFSETEVAAFDGWVRGGGGVMTTIGYTHDEATEVSNVNLLLAPSGMGYSATNLDLTDFVATWEQHPVTDGVSNIFTDNGVEPAGDGMTVASGNDARVALQVKQVDDGRVVVWGDEWITYDSEWQDVEDQQVELFWLNILKWLSPPKTCQVPIPDDVR